MPPYQNESLHDMHGLLKQLDTLNAAHAPEHLEMFEGMRNAANSVYNKANDMYNGYASEEQVIVHQFSKELKKEDALNLLLMSTEIRKKSDELLKDMVKSSTFKPIIMQQWYPNGIANDLRKSVYDEMNPPKPKK